MGNITTAADVAPAGNESSNRRPLRRHRLLYRADHSLSAAAVRSPARSYTQCCFPRASSPVLAELSADPDALVRAAALELPVNSDAPHRSIPRQSERWPTRPGRSVRALATAARGVAIEALAAANRDPHLDARKAAVSSLSEWAGDPDVSVALKDALDGADADVRAIARNALRAGCPER